MEVQMAAQGARSAGRSTPPRHTAHGHGHGGAKPVPSYLRPPASSCHHVCKYGGAHAFEDKDALAHRAAQPPPTRHRNPLVQTPPGPPPESQNRVLVKVRSVFRRRAGDSGRAHDRASKAAAAAGKAKAGEVVEWKDIVVVACSTVPLPPRESSPEPDDELSAHHRATGSGGDAMKKDATTKGNKNKKKPNGKAKITGQQQQQQVGRSLKSHKEPLHKSGINTTDTRSVKPPKGKNKPSALLVENMAIDQETLHGYHYQTLSPSLVQSRANHLRDLEKEMVVQVQQEAADVKQEETRAAAAYSLDQDECAAAESRRPMPAHRRAKSMGMSSRSVRFPFARQASKSSATFKLRSRSTRAPVLPPPEEEGKATTVRSRRGEDASGSSSAGRGIQLRIRSLRRRGVGGGTGTAGGFVVPVVALRHQKTLEKKKSQRLYNNVIEETASKLVKTRKSRVKALVGAFESVISRIAK